MEYIVVGKIVSTHGIKGEIKVQSNSSFKEKRFAKKSKLYIKTAEGYKEFIVESYRVHKNIDLLAFSGFNDINLVLPYVGKDLYAYTDINDNLKEDEYHVLQIIGMDVYQNNKLVGKVNDIIDYPQGPYLEIVSKKKNFVPFRKEFIEDVDLEKKIITLVNMEGLICE